MSEDAKQPGATKENPAMGQIVGHLKDYPFLLITVAGLVILSGILIFDIEKLKEFKWLIYAVVLVPLGIQFLIEFKKMQPPRPAASAAPVQPQSPEPLPFTAPPPGKKAWVGMGICMLLFAVLAALPETELRDRDFALGFLVVALVAGGFAFAALQDVNRLRAGGRGTAITGMVLSAILALASLGWLMEAPPTAETAVPPAAPAPIPPLEATPPISGQPAFLAPTQEGMAPRPAAPAQPAAPDMTGQYQLMLHQVDGEAVASGGSLALRRLDGERYAWQAQLLVPDFGGVHALNYSGQFLRRDGAWFMRIAASDEPNWEDVGEVPMQMAFDGRNALFIYQYDGERIQSAWMRSR